MGYDVDLQWETAEAMRGNSGKGTLGYISAWQFFRGKGSRKEAEKEWQTAERNDKEGNKT